MARGNPRAATFMLPGLLTTMIISGSLFGIAMPMVLAREKGILRRFRVTPINASTMILAHGTTAVFQNAITFVLLLTVSHFVFKTEIAGSLRGTRGGLSLRRLLNHPPGSACRQRREGHGIGAAHHQPDLLSDDVPLRLGLSFRTATRSDEVVRPIPARDLHRRVAAGRHRPRGRTFVAHRSSRDPDRPGIHRPRPLRRRSFRWEGTEPISKRSIATILGAFVVVMIGAALVAPAFRMSEMPGSRAIEAGEAKGQVRVLRGATLARWSWRTYRERARGDSRPQGRGGRDRSRRGSVAPRCSDRGPDRQVPDPGPVRLARSPRRFGRRWRGDRRAVPTSVRFTTFRLISHPALLRFSR